MTGTQMARYFIVCLVILGVATVLAAALSPEPNSTSIDAAAALGVITAVAVGIERILEVAWTLVSQAKGSLWPMSLVSEQADKLLSSLNQKLTPFYNEASSAMTTLGSAPEKLKAAQDELGELKKRIEALTKIAPALDNQHINLLSASAFQSVNFLAEIDPKLRQFTSVANQAIVGVSDFVATFRDNPGRRLISIFVGATLGCVIAGLIGLDVFKAVLGVTIDYIGWHWGVAATGLLMGFGSSPTHEVIRVLQEVKKSRKADTDPAPIASVLSSTGVMRAHEAESVMTTMIGPVSTFSLRRPR
jgi:hypothetical protein